MRHQWIIGLCLLVSQPAMATDFVFQNDTAVLTIDSKGRATGLVQKSTDNQWLARNPAPFAHITCNQRQLPAVKAEWHDDVLRVSFAQTGIQADYRITAQPDYFVIELVDVRGESFDEIQLAQLNVTITQHIGYWLPVRWNSAFAVCWLGLSPRVRALSTSASVSSEFGYRGEKVALIAVEPSRLMEVIARVEKDFDLPHPTIDGKPIKQSDDVRRGYLFTDLTEANADQTIRYAKLGGFKYIMTYSSTWSTSLGSYPINTKNFPAGESSLKAVIDKCHAAGLKVGMHMLTSFVGRNDPLARPKPHPNLLKDAHAVLAQDIDAKTRDISAHDGLTGFPTKAAYYGAAAQGFEVVIDNEVIHYQAIGGDHDNTMLRCTRGANGTHAAAHKAGTPIDHLARRYGCYLVDLRTPLKDQLADRIAGLINRCGFDMIYFDGGECNSANGPAWYWVSVQQMAIQQRVKRDLLVQGSGGTPWTWHIFCRGNCDDFAAIAPKQYLDYHKIGDSWNHHQQSFMPAELGWWGFLDDQPHHPATSPDEVELYAVRMLALDTPVSLETNLRALQKNGRTNELLSLLGRYERLRLARSVPNPIRAKLRSGEWHLVSSNGEPAFRPIRYDTQRHDLPATLQVTNGFDAQPLQFTLRAVPHLASPEAADNITLVNSDPPIALASPTAQAAMPGALAGRVEFTKPEGQQWQVFMVGPGTRFTSDAKGKALDLLHHRGLAVTLKVDQAAGRVNGTPPVLNIQLEGTAETYREHYVDLDFVGERTIVIPAPTTERMLPEFRPSPKNYRFKAAGYHFNYAQIVALNFRWMRLPKAGTVHCAIKAVHALAESDTQVTTPTIVVGSNRVAFPVNLTTGDYLEVRNGATARVFDRNGVLKHTVKPRGKLPTLAAGRNSILIEAAAPTSAQFTSVTLGPGLSWP